MKVLKNLPYSFMILIFVCCQTNTSDLVKPITQKQSDSILKKYDTPFFLNDTTGITPALLQVYHSDSLDVITLCKLALIKMQLKQYTSATLLLNKAQYIGKFPSEVYYTRAVVYSMFKPKDTAFYYLEKAITTCSDSIKYLKTRAQLYIDYKNFDLALLDLDKINSIDKNDITPSFSKSFIYYDTEQWELARDTTTKAIKMVEAANKAHFYRLDELYNIRASAYLKLGDFKNALLDADRAILLDPRKERFYKVRGYAKNNLGQKESSFEDMKKAAELGDPEAIEIYNKYLEHKKNNKNI